MPNDSHLLEKLKSLMAAAALAVTVGVGAASLPTTDPNLEAIRVAGFNIQVFGKTKSAKTDVMDVLVDVAQEFDVMVVQEVRDKSQSTPNVYLDAINAASSTEYAMFVGDREGRTDSKEQYVIYYVPSRVHFLGAYAYPDEADEFERPPIVASFRSGEFDFTLLACHIKPEHADAELRALARAAAAVRQANPDEEDVILLGDFNADGDYLDEHTLTDIFPVTEYAIAITDEMDTMTSSDNTYDRIILSPGASTREYVAGSAQVFEFDWEYGISDQGFVREVSDHYPVFAEFTVTLTDDD